MQQLCGEWIPTCSTSMKDGAMGGTHMERDVVWHELQVMYCFHRMPCTLRTCHNWPWSCPAIETYSESDRQRREKKGRAGETLRHCDRMILQRRMNCKYWPLRGGQYLSAACTSRETKPHMWTWFRLFNLSGNCWSYDWYRDKINIKIRLALATHLV